MPFFTPLESSLGGALIGLSATLVLLVHGRIAGISGILWSAHAGADPERTWRRAFVVGLILAGTAVAWLSPPLFAITSGRAFWIYPLAGLVVGFGVRMGGGCTSGHGVCGLSRLSPRSLLATVTFMATGAITVWAGRVLGGAS